MSTDGIGPMAAAALRLFPHAPLLSSDKSVAIIRHVLQARSVAHDRIRFLALNAFNARLTERYVQDSPW